MLSCHVQLVKKNLNFIMCRPRALYDANRATWQRPYTCSKLRLDCNEKKCYYPHTGISLCFSCEIGPLSFGRERWARRDTGISTLEKCHSP